RDTRGIRRYSEADIARLRELRSATDLGFPIGEAARLKPKELAELVRVKAPQGTVSRPRTRRGRGFVHARGARRTAALRWRAGRPHAGGRVSSIDPGGVRL